MNAHATLGIPHRDGWLLTPEGAALQPGARTAVIADVHLGYEWARGTSGDCLPAHSLAETLAKLARLLARATIDRLVIAGDLVESFQPCARTTADVRRLTRWLDERGVVLVRLAGNHDPRHVPPLPETMEVAGWTVGHGHRPITAPRTISGHHHPVLRAGGVCAPCFLAGPRMIVLPAFSDNAAGWNIAAGPLPPGWRDEPLRCVAGSGGELFDFGPLPDLRSRLRCR
jgi:uncharacterized protein